MRRQEMKTEIRQACYMLQASPPHAQLSVCQVIVFQLSRHHLVAELFAAAWFALHLVETIGKTDFGSLLCSNL